MFSLNRAQIIGNLTRDPEMRYTPNGQAVASFAIATNRRWKDKDGNNQEQTEFHDVVAWGKLAEIMTQILHKGNKVYVEGRLQTRQWEAQDGAKRNKTEVVIEDFVALSPKGEFVPGSAHEEPDFSAAPTEDDKPAAKKPVAKKEVADEEEINLDEIPF
ncbi:MAG: single-stranded DNA-binding protein [Candidatus Berkelbacteria bacterium]